MAPCLRLVGRSYGSGLSSRQGKPWRQKGERKKFKEIVTKSMLVEWRRLREEEARWKKIGGRNTLDTYFNKRGGCNLNQKPCLTPPTFGINTRRYQCTSEIMEYKPECRTHDRLRGDLTNNKNKVILACRDNVIRNNEESGVLRSWKNR